MGLGPSGNVGRWVLLRLFRRPLVWVWLALMLGLWPLVQALSPLGIASNSYDPTGPFYESAFLSTLVGSTLTLGLLASSGWILEQAPARRRLRGEAGGLLAGGSLFLCVGVLVPILWASWAERSVAHPTPAPWLSLFGAGALVLLHLTGLSLLILRIPAPAILRAGLLPLISWVIPAAISSESVPGRILTALLDASGHLHTFSDPTTTPTALASALAPIMGMFLAAALIESPPRRDP